MIFDIQNSKQIDIQAGDWIDVDVGMWGGPDPVWGFSVEVYAVDEDYIWCNVWNGTGYDQSATVGAVVVDNFRKVPFEA